MVDFEIGCVLFVDEINGVNGIGYSPTTNFIKVNEYSELDKNIIWITNLSPKLTDTFTSKNIKSSHFFGIKIDSLIYQMGLSTLPRKNVVKEIYNIVKNTIDAVSKNYDVRLYKNTLVKNLIDNFNLSSLEYNDDQKIVDLLRNNNSNVEITNIARTKNELQAYVFYPRYEYIRKLCKTSIPKGSWKELDKKVIRDKSNKWFVNLSKKYHFVALVKLTNIKKELDYLLPSKYKNAKIWITDAEYNFFVNYCKIHVDEVKVCTGRMHLEQIEPKKLFKLHSYEKTSISNGLAAYNYLYSFLEHSPDSILSSWIKRSDKVRMLNVAMIFAKYDLKVTSFGAGGLLISVKDESGNIDKVIKICEKLNLYYPMLLLTI
jgi:hypothetical protein